MLKKNKQKSKKSSILLNPQATSATVFKLTAKYFLKFDLERHQYWCSKARKVFIILSLTHLKANLTSFNQFCVPSLHLAGFFQKKCRCLQRVFDEVQIPPSSLETLYGLESHYRQQNQKLKQTRKGTVSILLKTRHFENGGVLGTTRPSFSRSSFYSSYHFRPERSLLFPVMDVTSLNLQ